MSLSLSSSVSSCLIGQGSRVERQGWFSLDSRLLESLFLALGSRQTLVTQHRLTVGQTDTGPLILGEDCLEALRVLLGQGHPPPPRLRPRPEMRWGSWAKRSVILDGRHLGGIIFSKSVFSKPLRKKCTQTHNGHAKDLITALALEVGAPAGSSRYKRSRGIGTELTESPIFLELKPHWLAHSELIGFYLCQALNTGNRKLGLPAHIHKSLQSPFSSAVPSPKASPATSAAENATPILIEEARPHPTKKDGPGLHS